MPARTQAIDELLRTLERAVSSGDIDQQLDVLEQLNTSVHQDKACREALIEAGGADLLVGGLNDLRTRRLAASTLAEVLDSPKDAPVLAQRPSEYASRAAARIRVAGASTTLVHMLTNGSPAERLAAAWAIRGLFENPFARTLLFLPGYGPLGLTRAITGNLSATDELLQKTAWMLLESAAHRSFRLLEATDLRQYLMNLLRSDRREPHTLPAIARFAYQDRALHDLLLEQKWSSSIIACLNSERSVDAVLAARAISYIGHSTAFGADLCHQGAAEGLLQHLDASDPLQDLTLAALRSLSFSRNPVVLRAIEKAGAHQRVAVMLAKAPTLWPAVMHTLARFAASSSMAREIGIVEGLLPRVVSTLQARAPAGDEEQGDAIALAWHASADLLGELAKSDPKSRRNIVMLGAAELLRAILLPPSELESADPTVLWALNALLEEGPARSALTDHPEVLQQLRQLLEASNCYVRWGALEILAKLAETQGSPLNIHSCEDVEILASFFDPALRRGEPTPGTVTDLKLRRLAYRDALTLLGGGAATSRGRMAICESTQALEGIFDALDLYCSNTERTTFRENWDQVRRIRAKAAEVLDQLWIQATHRPMITAALGPRCGALLACLNPERLDRMWPLHAIVEHAHTTGGRNVLLEHEAVHHLARFRKDTTGEAAELATTALHLVADCMLNDEPVRFRDLPLEIRFRYEIYVQGKEIGAVTPEALLLWTLRCAARTFPDPAPLEQLARDAIAGERDDERAERILGARTDVPVNNHRRMKAGDFLRSVSGNERDRMRQAVAEAAVTAYRACFRARRRLKSGPLAVSHAQKVAELAVRFTHSAVTPEGRLGGRGPGAQFERDNAEEEHRRRCEEVEKAEREWQGRALIKAAAEFHHARNPRRRRSV
jgi:hypothetical protein